MRGLRQIIAINAGWRDVAWRRFVARWSLIAAIILGGTACLSLGWYFPDEYWQTIEFANCKLGGTPVEAMPWEFPAQMRPWLQPALYFAIAKTAGAVGFTDPFNLTLFFRLSSALCGWLAVTALMFGAYRLYPAVSPRKAAVYLLTLTAFLPYTLVRTSSEATSSAFSMLGFALLILGDAKRGDSLEQSAGGGAFPGRLLFAVGLLWGAAFEFRYQAALFIAGFVFWLFFIRIKTARLPAVAALFGGIFTVVALGVLLDTWGYGAPVFAPWNYFTQNILHGKAAEFGVSPWYGYATLLLKPHLKYGVPLLLFLAIGAIIGSIRYPRQPLAWGLWLLVIAHSAVGHKELRFLTNALLPAILLTVYAFSPRHADDKFWTKVWRWRGSIPLKIVYALNCLLLLHYPTALNNDEFPFIRWIYRNVETPATLYSVGSSPYSFIGEPQRGLHYWFYLPPQTTVRHTASLQEALTAANGASAVWVMGRQMKKNLSAKPASIHFIPPDKTAPPQIWTLNLVYFYEKQTLFSAVAEAVGGVANDRPAWVLYKLDRQ
ncbi:hypothetical protein FACS1894139_05440 [Planctomycetales bacterium]|nr:hypothetical protein FACS1894107_11590 [Planctomycetales bacterium]GHT00301.1 hypothetical protein FACS1894108_12050 [Planctomycetales bacterium]GHT04002.1 hypothetical protein FACS1894139_05440 [Planctomycetales bacterium]